MRRGPCIAIAAVLYFATAALAADNFVAGDLIRLKDPAGVPLKRRATFKATRDLAIAPGLANDPRVLGATVEVFGTGVGDGTTGVLNLPAGNWIGLGNPTGSTGYKYVDKTDAVGVRRVVLRSGPNGGKLVIVGRGLNWPYAVTQAQASILVHFGIGTENYCAQFVNYTRNEAEYVVGKYALAPTSCAPSCGDGIVGGVEECDDGGTASSDGCSSTCELEDTSAVCAGMPTVGGTDITAVRVAQGLSMPNTITAPPLDVHRVFVVEKQGAIRIIEDGVLLGTPFLDINSRVIATNQFSEQGLLGLAFHPDYENNRRFFVNYTDNAGDSVIARYEASAGDPDVALFASENILLTINDFAGNHNGGNLAFGPDGYLYFGNGDGGGGGDPNETGQDDNSLFGKMLRFDVDVEGAPFYAVPASNPNPGAGMPLGLIWAKGLRNPWRFSFDRLNGDLYIGDVGQNVWEELDWVPGTSTGGENYGWDIFEANACFEPDPLPMCPATTGFTMPVHEYDHGDGCSVTGGFVYRGCALPDLHGHYFYSDYCTPFIRTFEISGGAATNHQDRTAALDPPGSVDIDSIVSYGEDARGEMYITDQNGEIFKIVPQ